MHSHFCYGKQYFSKALVKLETSCDTYIQSEPQQTDTLCSLRPFKARGEAERLWEPNVQTAFCSEMEHLHNHGTCSVHEKM